jgi:hypothetical protein
MRRLLQSTSTGFYYQGPGAWTRDPGVACSFHRTSGAIECCLRERLADMQVVLKFEDSSFDVRFPCFLQGAPQLPARHAGAHRHA